MGSTIDTIRLQVIGSVSAEIWLYHKHFYTSLPVKKPYKMYAMASVVSRRNVIELS